MRLDALLLVLASEDTDFVVDRERDLEDRRGTFGSFSLLHPKFTSGLGSIALVGFGCVVCFKSSVSVFWPDFVERVHLLLFETSPYISRDRREKSSAVENDNQEPTKNTDNARRCRAAIIQV